MTGLQNAEMSKPTTQALTPIKKAFTFGTFRKTDQLGIAPKTNKKEGRKIIINEIIPKRILCCDSSIDAPKNPEKVNKGPGII